MSLSALPVRSPFPVSQPRFGMSQKEIEESQAAFRARLATAESVADQLGIDDGVGKKPAPAQKAAIAQHKKALAYALSGSTLYDLTGKNHKLSDRIENLANIVAMLKASLIMGQAAGVNLRNIPLSKGLVKKTDARAYDPTQQAILKLYGRAQVLVEAHDRKLSGPGYKKPATGLKNDAALAGILASLAALGKAFYVDPHYAGPVAESDRLDVKA